MTGVEKLQDCFLSTETTGLGALYILFQLQLHANPITQHGNGITARVLLPEGKPVKLFSMQTTPQRLLPPCSAQLEA